MLPAAREHWAAARAWGKDYPLQRFNAMSTSLHKRMAEMAEDEGDDEEWDEEQAS